MNAWYNGVPKEMLVGLMESRLGEKVEQLMQWDGPHAIHGLWSAINNVGKVARGRNAGGADGEPAGRESGAADAVGWAARDARLVERY